MNNHDYRSIAMLELCDICIAMIIRFILEEKGQTTFP